MNKRWLIILLSAVAFVLVLGIGAAAGGAGVYYLLHKDVPEVFAETGTLEGGVIIAQVQAGSPAEVAGLVRGDILLTIDSKEVISFLTLRRILKDYKPGDTLTLTVLHGDETRTLPTTLEKEGDLLLLGVSTCMPSGSMAGFNTDGSFEFDRDIQVITTAGVMVTEVIEDSPADTAGLKADDHILSVDGQRTGILLPLAELIKSYNPGDEIELEIDREGETQTLEVTLGEHPDEESMAYLGIHYQPAHTDLMLDFDDETFHYDMPFHKLEEGMLFSFPGGHHFESLPEGVETAIIIGDVLEDSPAAEAGLQADDIILAVDDIPVEDPESFAKDIRNRTPGDEITLTIFQDGEISVVRVTLGSHPDNPKDGYLGVRLTGFFKMHIEGELPEDSHHELEKELILPGGDA